MRDIPKNAEGADPDVGRVVPLVGQALGDGHVTLQHAQAVGPVRKIGKRDDAHAPHACGLAQHGFGVAQVLQGVDLQHDIEAVVLEDGQPVVQVELQYVDALLQAGLHLGVVDFDPVAAALALGLQVGQQVTIAATQIEHARPGRDPLGDEVLQAP